MKAVHKIQIIATDRFKRLESEEVLSDGKSDISEDGGFGIEETGVAAYSTEIGGFTSERTGKEMYRTYSRFCLVAIRNKVLNFVSPCIILQFN